MIDVGTSQTDSIYLLGGSRYSNGSVWIVGTVQANIRITPSNNKILLYNVLGTPNNSGSYGGGPWSVSITKVVGIIKKSS